MGLAVALFIAPTLASAQHNNNGHSSNSGHSSGGHSTASHASFGAWHSAGGHTTPLSHGAVPARGSQAPQQHIVPNSTYHGAPYYRGTTHYTSSHALNASYARNAGSYPGAAWVFSGNGRWYNGYWHNYWANADWVWFNGFYGFWFPLDGVNVFVYEVAPGVCQYWDGNEWVPYYDPDTGYYCPY